MKDLTIIFFPDFFIYSVSKLKTVFFFLLFFFSKLTQFRYLLTLVKYIQINIQLFRCDKARKIMSVTTNLWLPFFYLFIYLFLTV